MTCNINRLQLSGGLKGVLWNKKKPPNKESGAFLCITSSSDLSQHKYCGRFLHVAINRDGKIAGADHQGHVYVFDLERNRFQLLCIQSSSPTSICWNESKSNEIFIALTNAEVLCYDAGSKKLKSVLKGHTTAANSISIHSSAKYAVTSSADTAILWDLMNFTKKRSLSGAENVGVQKVFFLPRSNKIVSCFSDDSIFVWNCETMKCLHQLSSPTGKKLMIKSLCVSSDGAILAAGGKSKYLCLWNIEQRELTQVIKLSDCISQVKQIEFIANLVQSKPDQILAVLSSHGIVNFIDIHSCYLLTELRGCEQRVLKFSVNDVCCYFAAVLENGDIMIYHTGQILLPEKTNPKVQKLATVDIEDVKQKKTRKKPKLDDVNNKQAATGEKDMLYRELPEGLSMKRLRFILNGYGEYPSKYRLFIWKNILKLPENHASFSSLVEKGTHQAFVNLQETFPIKDKKLLRVLQRVLSALVNWSPILAEVDYLPLMAFPFVKLFPNNQLVCFEIIASILCNWCQKWMEFFPHPPINILSSVEKLLTHHDTVLFHHFMKMNVSVVKYGWPLLNTLFTEVFTREDWLVVWDHIFTNHPAFMICFMVSYLICSQKVLLAISYESDFEYFLHHRNPVDLPSVIKKAYEILNSTPKECSPVNILNDFIPLTRSQYPVVNSYPKFVVNYLMEERERIRQEESEYLKQREIALKNHAENKMMHEEELAFYRDQEMLVMAEQERRQLIKREEEKLNKQRQKLEALQVELVREDLSNFNKVRKKSFKHQKLIKNIELQRLEEELQKKKKEIRKEKGKVMEMIELSKLPTPPPMMNNKTNHDSMNPIDMYCNQTDSSSVLSSQRSEEMSARRIDLMSRIQSIRSRMANQNCSS